MCCQGSNNQRICISLKKCDSLLNKTYGMVLIAMHLVSRQTQSGTNVSFFQRYVIILYNVIIYRIEFYRHSNVILNGFHNIRIFLDISNVQIEIEFSGLRLIGSKLLSFSKIIPYIYKVHRILYL